MSQHRILGIDPGLSGGVALFSTDGLLAEPMPVLKLRGRGELDLAALSRLLGEWEPTHAWLEEQQAMPRQGVASTFRTGLNYGTLLGLLTGRHVPLTTVRPAAWKRTMGVPADKAAAIAIATRLFPASASAWSRRRDDGVAEAALIACYGHRQLISPDRTLS